MPYETHYYICTVGKGIYDLRCGCKSYIQNKRRLFLHHKNSDIFFIEQQIVECPNEIDFSMSSNLFQTREILQEEEDLSEIVQLVGKVNTRFYVKLHSSS